MGHYGIGPRGAQAIAIPMVVSETPYSLTAYYKAELNMLPDRALQQEFLLRQLCMY